MAEKKDYTFEEQLAIMGKRWSVVPLSTEPAVTNPHLKMAVEFEVSNAEELYPSDMSLIKLRKHFWRGVTPVQDMMGDFKKRTQDMILQIKPDDSERTLVSKLNEIYQTVYARGVDGGVFEYSYPELLAPLEGYMKPLPIMIVEEDKDGKKKRYLDYSWEALSDQQSKRRKVFLVIDNEAVENGKKKPKIVFYFAMSCGLVQDDPVTKISKDEDALIEIIMKAIRFGEAAEKKKEKAKKAQMEGVSGALEAIQKADADIVLAEAYKKELEDYADRVYSKETAAKIKDYAKTRAKRRGRKLIDTRKEAEKRALRVNETAPGIELSHFVKAAGCKMPEGIDFSAGAYVFWELIYDKIKTVEENVGLKYIYLFAAETNPDAEPEKILDLLKKANEDLQKEGIVLEESEEYEDTEEADGSADVQPMTEEEAMTQAEAMANADQGAVMNVEANTRDISAPLMTYYRNSYGFNYDTDVTLYKPPYDLGCFSMSTTFEELKEKREEVWKK